MGQKKFTRADTLGEDYIAERIVEQIAEIQKALAVMERFSEKKAPEKPVTVPKAELTPTDTATTKLTATPTEPPKSKGLTDEEILALLDEKSAEITPASKSTESKLPEKKEDVWATIRGMGKADEIITDLETVGITSPLTLSSRAL